jgi:3',5'-cyclic AMP phosphodiesterase CpdA
MLRIVHLSDLHISTDPVDYEAPFFSGLEGVEIDSYFSLAQTASNHEMAQIPPQPEATHCIVSGDLSASGRNDELGNALTFIESKVIFSTAVPAVGLEYDRSHSHMILGNHDIWGGKSPLLAWYRSKDKKNKAAHVIWRSYPTSWDVGAQTTFADTDGLRVRVYLLDSTWPGVRNVFARGRVDQAQLDKLKNIVLEDERVDRDTQAVKSCLRIAVLHHPIYTYNKHWFTMLLERAQAVQATLEELSFGLVLCGHEHLCDYRELATTRVPSAKLWQCLSGTATQITNQRDKNEFLVYDISSPSTDSYSSCTVVVRRFTRPGIQRAEFKMTHEEPIKPKVVEFDRTETKTGEHVDLNIKKLVDMARYGFRLP